ncbi:MAG TPA: hypothetical protein ENL03_03420, partial [Phycisphaerae bacterium]|nr:hypothetical protein [Phycisphaerae bacterium]
MKYLFSISMFAVFGVLFAPEARADIYVGQLSSGNGLTGTGDWATGITLDWTVSNEDLNAPSGFPWKYSYTLSVAKKDPSHFIIEASDEDPGPMFTAANLTGLVGGALDKV